AGFWNFWATPATDFVEQGMDFHPFSMIYIRRVPNNHLRAFHHILHFLLPSFVGVYSAVIKFLVVNLTELVML
ncbi:unnamed protein product, partial [Prunus brigantina]